MYEKTEPPLYGRLRNYRLLRERFFVGIARKGILRRHGWYRSLSGGWAHPHAMDCISRHEAMSLTPAQLDYLLTRGTMSLMPEELDNPDNERRYVQCTWNR